MRFAARVAYNGTAYKGFQRQGLTPTVQLEIESALKEIAGRSVRIQGAGRTDTGVHATGQVIAFSIDWRHANDALQAALNARLAHDIAVLDIKAVDENFDPRRHAVSRTYQYRLYVSDVRDPLRQNLAWHVTPLPSPGNMKDAAMCLTGAHDFTSFGTPPHGSNAVRTVDVADWTQQGADHTFIIRADAFLFRMVRTLVSTMVNVGQEKMTVAEFQAILAARKRGLASAPAPACGLTLIAVTYGNLDWS